MRSTRRSSTWVLALIARRVWSRASASGSMPRPWRPTRRCATSCGGTRARVTGAAGALGPGERHRDIHGRGPGAPGPQAQGARSSRTRTGSRRATPSAKIAKMKDGTTHLAYKPEHAVDLDTGAVVAAELHPADEGDSTTLSWSQDAAGGQGESRGGGRRTDGRSAAAECVTTRAIDPDALGLHQTPRRSGQNPVEDRRSPTSCSKVLRAGRDSQEWSAPIRAFYRRQPDPAVTGRPSSAIPAARSRSSSALCAQ